MAAAMKTTPTRPEPGLIRNDSIDPSSLQRPAQRRVRSPRTGRSPTRRNQQQQLNDSGLTSGTGGSGDSFSSIASAGRWNNESVKFSAKNFVTSNSGTLEAHYELGELIGEGGFGEVYACKHLATEEIRAVKVMEKSTKKQSINDDIVKEYNILKELDHPNILKVYEMYETKHHFFIITDLYSGGDLFSELEDEGVFSEHDAAQLMNTMLTCMNYCHKRGLVHLDLKPENVLLPGRGIKDYANVKIIDFGLAQYQESEDPKLTGLEGSSYYMSPQVVKRSYKGDKADVWSCGVVCHVMMTGYAPFDGPEYKDILASIVKGEFDFSDPEWDGASDVVKDFIKYCLTYDEEERPSAQEVLQHPFLAKLRRKRNSRDDRRRSSVCSSLKDLEKFESGHSKLKQATCAIMASQLLTQEEKDEIDEVFRSLDISCNGQLSKEDLIRCYKEYFDQKLSEKEADRLFEQVNFSGSGYIEYSEFTIAIMMSQNMVNEGKLHAAFKLFDMDGKGYISSDDIKRVLNLEDQHDEYLKKKILRQVDAEESGKIVFKDFKEIIESSKSTRKNKKGGKAMALKRTKRTAHASVSPGLTIKVDAQEVLGASLLDASFWDDDSSVPDSFRRNLSGSSNYSAGPLGLRRQVTPKINVPGSGTNEANLEDLVEVDNEDHSSVGDLFDGDDSDSTLGAPEPY